MGLWQEMNDFSDYSKRLPCPNCKGESEPTLVGGHFKCGQCSHLFNEDNSKLDIDCFCDKCQPQKELDVPMSKDLKKKVNKKKKK
jgi:rubredoxin